MAFLRWVLLFLILALFAPLLGSHGMAFGLSDIAKALLFIFVILLVSSLFFGGRSSS